MKAIVKGINEVRIRISLVKHVSKRLIFFSFPRCLQGRRGLGRIDDNCLSMSYLTRCSALQAHCTSGQVAMAAQTTIAIAMDTRRRCGPYRSIRRSTMVALLSTMNRVHRHSPRRSATGEATIPNQVSRRSKKNGRVYSLLVPNRRGHNGSVRAMHVEALGNIGCCPGSSWRVRARARSEVRTVGKVYITDLLVLLVDS